MELQEHITYLEDIGLITIKRFALYELANIPNYRNFSKLGVRSKIYSYSYSCPYLYDFTNEMVKEVKLINLFINRIIGLEIYNAAEQHIK